MKNWRVLVGSALPLLLLSCQHAGTPSPTAADPATKDAKQLEALQTAERGEVLKAASQRLDEARAALQRGNFDEAEAGLQPLLDQGIFTNEVNRLRADISQAKEKVTIALGKKEADERAFMEVDQRYTLPGNYGSTVTINGDAGPLTIPPGPMEALFSKKVTLKVQNAGVKELVQALTQIEGLNIIADDALEAKKTLTIDVRDTPLAEIFSYVARNMGITFTLGDNVVWVSAAEETDSKGPKLETHIYRLQQGFAPQLKADPAADAGGKGGGQRPAGAEDTELEDAIESLTTEGPEGASYRIFKNRNLLMVRNSRENLRAIEKLIADFDRAPRQVLIEARFLTISQDDLRDLGVGIRDTTVYANTPNRNDPAQASVTDFLSRVGALTPLTSPDGIGSVTVSGILAGRTFDVTMAALATMASTHTISAPRVTVLNNHSARIRRGDKVLYYDELETVTGSGGTVNVDGSSIPGTSGTTVNNAQTAFTGTPKELELGVTLEVKVNIGNDGQTVMLDLMPQVIELKRWRSFAVVAGGNNNSTSNNSSTGSNVTGKGEVELPETTESVVNTTVAVKSGETVALGGMIENTTSKKVTKVPWLGDIPYLGVLFRHTEDKDYPRHLLIFVTATVISDSGQFVKVKGAAQ